MRTQLAIPILASILILGVIGAPQDVFSQTIIDSDFGDNVEVGSGELTTITNGATVSGNVIVDGGSVTINDGAVIEGNIEVTNGGSLTMDDATVSGNVIVDGGGSIAITGTDIGGNVEIMNTDDVIVSGNSINGNIVLENVTGTDCNVFDNDTNGNLENGDCSTEPPTPNTPPTVEILTPENDDLIFFYGYFFTATASDFEDDDLTDSIVWATDLSEGVIRTGGVMASLPYVVGTHIVTATVTDSNGATATDSRRVILPPGGDCPPFC